MALSFALFTALAVCVLGGRALGQGATGTILGTVTDTTGAILPNARVVVTNTQTAAVVNNVTSSTGDFRRRP